MALNTDAIFDVQVKRLHEYKRQLLNVLHIVVPVPAAAGRPQHGLHAPDLPLRRQGGPGLPRGQADHPASSTPWPPRSTHDPICKDKLQVVFLENYRVSLAEKLMPASELIRADLHRRQGGQRHRQHEVHDERRPDHRHPGRSQRGDAPAAGGREHLPFRPHRRPGGGAHAARAIALWITTSRTRCSSGCWTRSPPASPTAGPTPT